MKCFVLKILLFTMVLLSSTMLARAQECETDNITPDLYRQAQAMATNARNDMLANHLQETSRAQQSMQSLQNCLSKYKNVKVGASLGLPSLSDLTDKALGKITNQVCNKIDGVYENAQQATKQKVSLPGGLGGAEVRLPGSGELRRNRY